MHRHIPCDIMGNHCNMVLRQFFVPGGRLKPKSVALYSYIFNYSAASKKQSSARFYGVCISKPKFHVPHTLCFY